MPHFPEKALHSFEKCFEIFEKNVYLFLLFVENRLTAR